MTSFVTYVVDIYFQFIEFALRNLFADGIILPDKNITELAEIQFKIPKPNLTPGEQQALTQLSRDKDIILKEADKGTASVMMSRESKIKEG